MTADWPAAAPCPDCRQPIRWLTTVAGARMPVDAAPHPTRGNVVMIGGQARVLGPSDIAEARAVCAALFTHHALSCPHAGRWHRPHPSGG